MLFVYECTENIITDFKKFYDTQLSAEDKRKIFIPTYDCMKKYQGTCRQNLLSDWEWKCTHQDGTQSQGKRKTLSAGKCDATMEKLIRIINLFF